MAIEVVRGLVMVTATVPAGEHVLPLALEGPKKSSAPVRARVAVGPLLAVAAIVANACPPCIIFAIPLACSHVPERLLVARRQVRARLFFFLPEALRENST
jgi:hypothetical protein